MSEFDLSKKSWPPELDELPIARDHWGSPLSRDYDRLMIYGGDLLASLQRYHWFLILPGGFLCAVIANDLTRAVMTADPTSMSLLKELCWYVRNEMPSWMVGSYEALDQVEAERVRIEAAQIERAGQIILRAAGYDQDVPF